MFCWTRRLNQHASAVVHDAQQSWARLGACRTAGGAGQRARAPFFQVFPLCMGGAKKVCWTGRRTAIPRIQTLPTTASESAPWLGCGPGGNEARAREARPHLFRRGPRDAGVLPPSLSTPPPNSLAQLCLRRPVPPGHVLARRQVGVAPRGRRRHKPARRVARGRGRGAAAGRHVRIVCGLCVVA